MNSFSLSKVYNRRSWIRIVNSGTRTCSFKAGKRSPTMKRGGRRKTVALLLLLVMVSVRQGHAQGTRTPTQAPSRRPMNAPTQRPQQTPTRRPTPRPPPRPTPRPTPAPGEPPLPAQLLLTAPTALPSDSPSRFLSESPSYVSPFNPTDIQFNTASSLPVQQILAADVEMTIGGILLPLGDGARESFEEITSDSITRSVVDVLGKDNIENLEMSITLIPPYRKLIEENARDERSDNETLLFDALIRIQSVIRVHDANRYIVGAFNGPDEQTKFLDDLKETGYEEFMNVMSVSVAPIKNVTVLGTVNGSADTESKNKNLLAIVIPVVVSAILAIVGIAICKRRRTRPVKSTNIKRKHVKGNGSKVKYVKDDESKINMIVNTTMDTSNMSILEEPASDIIVDMGIDMSSLGDPSHLNGNFSMIGNSVIGGMSRMSDKVSVDFDFRDLQIHTDIPILDEDGNTTEAKFLSNTYKKMTLEERASESSDESSAVGPMSLMSGFDNDYHQLSKNKSLMARSTSSTDFYYDEVVRVMSKETQASTPPEGFSGGSNDGSSPVGTMSLVSAPESVDPDCFKATPRMSSNKRNVTPPEMFPKVTDDTSSAGGSVLLMGYLGLGNEKNKCPEDISVVDSIPRFSNTWPIGKATNSTDDEDITVTDSISRVSNALSLTGRLTKEVCNDDISVADSMSRVSDALTTDVDFQCNNLSKEVKDDTPISDNLSHGLFSKKHWRGIKQRKDDTRWEAASSIITSEGSLAAQFEASAPKGMLGLTLAPSSEGPPVVKTIAYSSPLAGRVKVGDWLLKLDGIDVTSMPAKDVNRLITSKKKQTYRRFVFSRTVEGMEGEGDSIYEA